MKLSGQIIGAILSIIGGLAALVLSVLFCALFLFVGPYGVGIVAAVICVLPVTLIGLAVSALGLFVWNRANKMPSPSRLQPYPPPNVVSHLLSQSLSPKKELS